MGRSSHANEGVARQTGEGTKAEGNLEILGRAPSPGREPVYPQVQAGLKLRALKPCELVRLLNSTPIGTVLSERQLYRHRTRAGYGIGGRLRIDLFRYIAWLMSLRHQGRAADSSKKSGQPPSKVQGERRLSRRRTTNLTAQAVLKLIKKQGYQCALTGRQLLPETCALDHIIPICHGGEHHIANAQVLHKDVNRAKNTLTNEQFIQLCQEVAAHAKSRARARRKMEPNAANSTG